MMLVPPTLRTMVYRQACKWKQLLSVLIFTLVNIASMRFLYLGGVNGWLDDIVEITPIQFFAIFIFLLLLGLLILCSATWHRRHALKMLAEHSQHLEELSIISSQINGTLDNPQKVLSTIVNQIHDQFAYYHVSLYLLDENGRYLTLVEASGVIGTCLKEKAHRICREAKHSLVARAVRQNKLMVVADVCAHEDWLPHPLLPKTRAEIALPLVQEGSVIGVLDVQHVSVMDDNDVKLLCLLANQVGTAISNARLYPEIEKAKALAEAANQAKSDFLVNLSHELRTPLNGILGHAQILQRDPNLTAVQLDEVQTIYSSGQHLLTLINDVLDLAKIEAGKLELTPEEFNLPDFLDEIVNLIQISTHKKKINFIYDIDPTLPAYIQADEKRLRQVLLNLLGNAVKFTEQGEVTFCVGHYRLKERSSTSAFWGRELAQLYFAVIDTGIGITADKLETIFQRFERSRDNDQRLARTGLGLTISQQLVHLMGGKIDVKSEPGKGSTFSFQVTCPVQEEVPTADSMGMEPIIGYQGRPRHILAVDDRFENLLVLQNLLEPLGFTLTTATSGQEGIEKAQESQPDLIFMEKYLNVTWVYDDSPENELEIPTAAEMDGVTVPITPPSQKELKVLYELADLGNMQRIQQYMSHLTTLSQQYRPFAKQIYRWAEEFDDYQIKVFVAQYLAV